jgi:trimeric autotransporter adhesin
MFTGRKLPLTLAFAVLITVAAGISCKGFFVNPTLTSITINPTAPSIEVGDNATLSAYGVYNDGTGNDLTAGVSWSSSDVTIAAITGTCATQACGSTTVQGVATGTATITASSESVTNTATATVYITISAIGITPTSASIKPSGTKEFLVYANNDKALTNPNDNLSSGATLTVTQGATTVTTISCSYDSSLSPPSQLCTASSAPGGSYTITATYPGSNLTATATLNIT